jgi:N-acetyl-gamma-glutamyl-phosphate reductase
MPARNCSAASPTACPNFTATGSGRRRWSRPPAAIRPLPAWPCAALLEAGVIERRGIIVDAASGVSGAGRAANAGTHFCTVDGSFRAYGLLKHRHTAEMELTTGAQVLFTPT